MINQGLVLPSKRSCSSTSSSSYYKISTNAIFYSPLLIAFVIIISIPPYYSNAFHLSAPTTLPSIRTGISLAPTSRPRPDLLNFATFDINTKCQRHELTKLDASAPSTTFPDSDSNSNDDIDYATSKAETAKNKQSMSASTFSLVKACVGSGVLALPAGVAAMGDVPRILIPASAIICLLGVLSAYSFYNIGRISHMGENDKDNYDSTKATNSISGSWEKEVDPKSSWMISLACFLTPIGNCLTYSIILGDTLSTLARSVGLQGFAASRQASILAITSTTLYPLCNLRSLASLAKVSILGVCGIALTCLVMFLRVLPGGPYNSKNGALLSTLHPSLQPSFGLLGGSNNVLFSPSVLVLISMAATSYLSHFAAPDFYDGLERGSKKRFGLLTGMGFSITILINIIIMSLGFLTFGGNCNGMILNNYSPKDIGATLCRIVVTISLIGSYPINLFSARSAYFELFQKGKEVSIELKKKVTRIFLATLTSFALLLNDAGFLVSLTGAVLGSAIIYVFPSIIFLKLTSRLLKEGKLSKKSKSMIGEILLNKMLIGLGTMLGLLGGTVTILNTFFPKLL